VRPLVAFAGLSVLLAACYQPLETDCGATGQACCDGTTCNAGLVCGADSLCRACGGEGQGCCNGTTCSTGLTCDTAGVCRACGGEGLGCCEGSTCSTGLECYEDGVCRGCGNDGQSCCGGTTCVTGLECASDKRCHACGADTEICCAGDLCDTGSECRADGLCHQCGEVGQECCLNDSCKTGMRCDNQLCVAPCGDGCAPGEKRCNSNSGIDMCGYAANPPCTAWTTIISRCPEEQVCTDGVCEERCPNACTLGSTLCTSEGLKICVLDETSQCPVYKVAPESPDNPSCMTGACDGNFCWESPLPEGNDLVGLAGWAYDQFHVLDNLGNVIHQDASLWTYEWRNTQGGRVKAIANCNSPASHMAVGADGLVLRRKSIGWVKEDLGNTTADLRAVGCASSLVSLAAGAGGQLYARSGDSLDGTPGTWRALTSPTTTDLHGVDQYTFGGEGWAVGDGGTIVHCTGLETPATTACAIEAAGLTTADLFAVWVNQLGAETSEVGRGEVIAVGAGGTVLSRAPGGSWSRVAQGVSGGTLRAVFGLRSGDIYAAGERGTFLFRNGGAWQTVTFTSSNLGGVFASDDSHLFVAGAGGEIWFNDIRGGEGPAPQVHWRQVGGRVPTREQLYGVGGTSASNVYAVGTGGTVLHKSGDAWRREAQGLISSELYGVTVVSANEIYAVGEGGVILARRDGIWRREGEGVTSNPLQAIFNDGTTVYAVGPFGTWIEKPVGSSGTYWHLVSQPAGDAYFTALSGNAEEIWAVGGFCTAVKKTVSTGAFTVETIPACDGEDFSSVWVGDDGEMFLGTEFDGLLLHRVQGQWAREFLGSWEPINGFAVRGGDSWAMCGSGELYHRVAGEWRQEAKGMTYSGLESAYATPEGDLFMVGANGLIWHRR
jgi:hypothetical protein